MTDVLRRNVEEMARGWQLDAAPVHSGIFSHRIGAVRWNHNNRQIADSSIHVNSLFCLRRPCRSTFIKGGRRAGAASRMGSMMFLPRGFYGAFEFDDTRDVVHVYLPDSIFDGVSERGEGAIAGRLQDALMVDDTLLMGLANGIGQALDNGGNDQLLVETMGAAIAARLLQRMGEAAVPRKGGLASWAERRCREYLQARLAENVSLKELATIAQLSPFHFARMFKISTGLPPHAYQRRLRAERACDMLRTTDLSISDIGAAVGYDTAQAFARMFRGETGSSPTQWRRALRA